jgi:mycofactocin precursor
VERRGDSCRRANAAGEIAPRERGDVEFLRNAAQRGGAMPDPTPTVIEAPPAPEPECVDDDELVEDELLVEDVSIDGMCGVY